MPPRRFSLIAAAAFVLYAGGSLVFGERFPFSTYDMYAAVRGTREGAVFTILADGVPAAIEDFERFSGIDPAAIYPAGIPCSMEYRVAEARLWLEARRAGPGEGAGPVHLQVAYRIISLEGGRLHERMQVVAEGTAWRR